MPDKGDEFYERIADEYLDRAEQSRRPAVDMAEQHDVPVTTAHRWVKEARRRGVLRPAPRPGRADDGTRPCPNCDGSGRVRA